jgi:hypothetical protein
MDAVARLLTLWGRRPAQPITVAAAHGGTLAAATAVLWSGATP